MRSRMERSSCRECIWANQGITSFLLVVTLDSIVPAYQKKIFSSLPPSPHLSLLLFLSLFWPAWRPLDDDLALHVLRALGEFWFLGLPLFRLLLSHLAIPCNILVRCCLDEGGTMGEVAEPDGRVSTRRRSVLARLAQPYMLIMFLVWIVEPFTCTAGFRQTLVVLKIVPEFYSVWIGRSFSCHVVECLIWITFGCS